MIVFHGLSVLDFWILTSGLDMSSLAFDGLLRKLSVRDERTVGRDVEPAVGLRVRSAHTIIQSLSAVE